MSKVTNPNEFVTQCAMSCNEPLFAAFLKDKYPEEWAAAAVKSSPTGGKNAATLALYSILNIKSRTELRTDPIKIEKWRPIHSDFEFWKADV